ncbi:isoprenoid synthase domain-containing protein [Aspergillus californicus]
MSNNHARPIRYRYKVIDEGFPDSLSPPNDTFKFLSRRTKPEDIPENAIVLNPKLLGAVWISSLKGCLQNIHWREAEATCNLLIRHVVERKRSSRIILPDGLTTADKERKSRELVETAVTIGIYLFPTAGLERIKVLTKAVIFLFLHDDVVESSTRNDGRTILENIDVEYPANKDSLAPFPEEAKRGSAQQVTDAGNDNLWAEFAAEARRIDPVLGVELVAAAQRWAQVTRRSATVPLQSFSSFEEYMKFRAADVGNEFLLAGVKFSCGLRLAPYELVPLAKIEKLYIHHASLVNDLYSYEKEHREALESGTAPINAVHVVHTLMDISTDRAKSVVRDLIWDTEDKLREEYTRLMAIPRFRFNTEQKRYLHRIIESTAGNVMYSCTTYRYARFTGTLIERSSWGGWDIIKQLVRVYMMPETEV